jgi:hypothetical protein
VKIAIYPKIKTIMKTSGYIKNERMFSILKTHIPNKRSSREKILNNNVNKRMLPTAFIKGPGRLKGKVKILNISPNIKTTVINTNSPMFSLNNWMIPKFRGLSMKKDRRFAT